MAKPQNTDVRTPPKGWGKDAITGYFEQARGNAYATFVNSGGSFQRLIHIDAIFRDAQKNMDNNTSWFSLLLFLKAHSAFLAAVQLAANTQISEAYCLLRSVLEYSLYGFYIYHKPDLGATWLRRHDNENTRKNVMTAFKIKDILTFLDDKHVALGKAFRILYDETIDWGAHPNERALSGSLKITKLENESQLEVKYLTDNAEMIMVTLKIASQVGVSVLKILQLVAPQCFSDDMQARLQKVSDGL